MHEHVADLFHRRRLTFIAGPCVIESRELCLRVGETVARACEAHGISYIFKASFDKANRTSVDSFRGPGLDDGLEVLREVRDTLGVPVLTDVHLPEQTAVCAEVVDVLQIPAFLCRQTDLLVAAAQTGLPTNVKKGQFLAPEDMRHVAGKFRSVDGAGPLAVTERGSTFGYGNLVVDMRGLEIMRQTTDAAVVFDATHSVQRPSAGDGVTTGDRRQAPLLARAAVAVGIDGIFAEVHPHPDAALSDGPNSLTFTLMQQMLQQVATFREAYDKVAP